MPNIKEDSAFAEAILPVIVKSPAAREALAIAAGKLSEQVIAPILAKLQSGTALNLEETEVLNFLATEHSKDGMQWGGVLPNLSKKAILDNPQHALRLATEIAGRLDGGYIRHIEDSETLAGVVKAITDCSFCYVEKLKSKHTKDFALVKSGVFPTPEELAIRVMRTEVGEAPQVAISYGIGTTPGVDIAPKDALPPPHAVRQHNAGKAVFLGADTLERMHVTARDYDKTIELLDDIKKKMAANPSGDHSELLKARDAGLVDLKKLSAQMVFYKIPLLPEYRDMKERSLEHIVKMYDKTIRYLEIVNHKIALNPGGDNRKLVADRERHNETLKRVSTEMVLHKIPFNPEERDSDLRSHNIRKPAIQKLAEWGGEPGDKLPLVATASGTTARTLIALQDLGAFSTREGVFVPEMAQYVSSALCGTIVHGGHHSVLEVAEMYNRLLDHHAISILEKRPVTPGVNIGSVEESMPYYRIGETSTLLPEAIRAPVTTLQEKILIMQSMKSTTDFKSRLEHSKPIALVPPIIVPNDGRSLN